MSESVQEVRSNPAQGDLWETVGIALGGGAGLASGITVLMQEHDGIFHAHQIDVAGNQLDAIKSNIAGLQQAERTLAQVGQEHSAAYTALEHRIALDQTKASAIERTTPHYEGGQVLEAIGLGIPSLIGCLAAGAALGTYLGKRIDRFRKGGRATPEPVEA